MGPVELARAGFALTVVFHYLFVALTLGLVLVVAILHTKWVRTGDPVYLRMTRFWGLLYVVNYIVGIGAGLVMEFQLGANWAGLENFSANVFGAPLAIETIVAFFAESTFLALWIFGWRRLPKKFHLATIWVVTAAAWMSALWALVANGFMQNPVGYEIRDGVVQITSYGALLGNVNLWIAVPHILTAAIATAGFFLLGISSILLRRGRADQEFLRRSMRIGGHAAGWGSLLAVSVGALQFIVVTEAQKSKFWAFIGASDDLALRQQELTAKYGPDAKLPEPAWVEFSGQAMMIIGLFMLIIGIWVLFALRKDRITTKSRVLRWLLVPMLFLPFVANISGWIFREVGRQPFAIWNVLTTNDAMTPGLTAGQATVFLTVFGILIGLLMLLDWWLLGRIALRGPDKVTGGLWADQDHESSDDDHSDTRRDGVLV
nr:cytochrome ubiquinol oxidase subunit I [Kibdelosporangium sp. MJ126-NF4]CEL19946.1 Cytochrome d ubiquinol oxidase subunit I [Kibdelosporangium sp. MJ126-NF4]CTQ97170.1 Cytochrome d ubiquinol oxidase subunit I (EC 1.10.3.-) [Kibdelosporangium sp. MJ126-NF4]